MRQLAFVIGLGAALVGAGFALGLFGPSTETTVVEAPADPAPAPAVSTPERTPLPAAARTESPRPATVRESAAPTPAPAAPVEAPTMATLRIDSDVPGAQVFIDNKFVGAAPVTANDVQPGQRKINVQAPGYESVAEFHDITPGPRDITISLKTIRLNEKVAVQHKHGIGSCQGTLIATPEGLRYETSHKEHGFVVTLQNIETFEADYLKNNVKLKIRGGRTYDFTDPSGKADPLYLFHQEVDKVRKRIGEGTR